MPQNVPGPSRKDAFKRSLQDAVGLHRAGKLDEADAIYRRLLIEEPGSANLLHLVGLVAYQQGRHEEAERRMRLAIRLKGDVPDFHSNLGAVLCERRRLDEAAAAHRRALELRPDFAAAWNNLGGVLNAQGLAQEAVAAYRRAVGIQPDYADAWSNLGSSLRVAGRYDESVAAYRSALAIRPDFAYCHFNLACTLLMTGRLEEGLAEHEWRWRCPTFTDKPRPFPRPAWDGSDPRGRTLLLHAEQGLGDTLHFVRYAPLLAGRGARVVVECQPELRGLLATAPGIDRLVARGEPLPAFDLHAPMLSVPHLAGTTMETIPARTPYLAAPPDRVQVWKGWIGAAEAALRASLAAPGRGGEVGGGFAGNPGETPRPPLRVGLCWSGNPRNTIDRNRSVPLASLAPLARAPGVVFYSVQKGPAAAQAAQPPPGMALIDLTARLTDFVETAALLAHLDLLVSVDTAVVHLAGAMNKPAWLLTYTPPDWRWFLGRDDSPWYPSLRIFRQPAPGDWRTPIERMGERLRGGI